jgi:hypothetical protein
LSIPDSRPLSRPSPTRRACLSPMTLTWEGLKGELQHQHCRHTAKVGRAELSSVLVSPHRTPSPTPLLPISRVYAGIHVGRNARNITHRRRTCVTTKPGTRRIAPDFGHVEASPLPYPAVQSSPSKSEGVGSHPANHRQSRERARLFPICPSGAPTKLCRHVGVWPRRHADTSPQGRRIYVPTDWLQCATGWLLAESRVRTVGVSQSVFGMLVLFAKNCWWGTGKREGKSQSGDSLTPLRRLQAL